MLYTVIALTLDNFQQQMEHILLNFQYQQNPQIPIRQQLIGGCQKVYTYLYHMRSCQPIELVFQNSKELKEVRQFVKGLHYVYDSITKRDKKIYFYVCKKYIAITNDFMNNVVSDYRPVMCVLRNHIFRFSNNAETFTKKGDDEGYLYLVDSDSILKFLNSHIEPEITQLHIFMPIPEEENQLVSMKLQYETIDGVQAEYKLYTTIQSCEYWPFPGGKFIQGSFLFNKAKSMKFISFQPKFAKSIDYAKKYTDIWLCLSPLGISLKRSEGDHIVLDHHIIRTQQTLQYNHFEIEQYLGGNNFICIRTAPFFHHIQLSNKQGKKSYSKIIVVRNSINKEIEKCFMLMQTLTDKKQIYEAFEIYPRQSIDFTPNYNENQQQRLPPRMINRQAKKQEDHENAQKIILNRFYGIQYEEQVNRAITIRQGYTSNNNGQNLKNEPCKYRIQIDQ